MPLPPALLERLKRRKIIQEVKSEESASPPPPPSEHKNTAKKEIDHLQARYGHGETSSIVQSEQDGQEEIIAADYSDEAEQDSEDDDEHDDQAVASSEYARELTSIRLLAKEHDVGYNQSNQEQDNEPMDNVGFQNQCDIIETIIGCPNKYNIHHFCSAYCAERYSQPESMEPTIEQRRMLARLLKAFPITNEWSIVYDPGVKTFYFWNIINQKVSWYPPGMGIMPVDSAESWRKLSRQQAEFGESYG